MYTFFSLSKSATSILLDISEVALLLFGLLLAVGIIGEYAESKSERWKKHVNTFAMFVIIGVAGELLADGGIFLFSRHLQTIAEQEIAELTKEAGDAKSSAKQAKADASAAKTSAQEAKGKASEANDASEKAKTVASDATTLARAAHREAGSVHQEIGRAAGQLTQLEAEAQKTKTDLINLALCNAPRVISNWFLGSPAGAKSYVDPLRPMAGQIVFIEVVPDAEARRAALNIAQTLLDAQWNVQKPLTFVDGLADGVSVQPSEPTFTASPKGEIPNMSPYWHASDVAEKLLDFLHSYNWQAVRGWPTDPQGKLITDEKILPPGAIRIQVGLYPAAVYVSPPGQKELTSRMEEIRREREKARAESKRKREEQWATFPPELRKRLQEADDEWEAKIKSVTSNGPCQVLNSPF